MSPHEKHIDFLERIASQQESEPDRSSLSRRALLRRGVGGAALLGMSGGLLAACGGSSPSKASSSKAPVKLAGLYRDLDEENFFRINDGVQAGAKLFANKSAQPLIYHNDSTTEETVIQGALNALGSGEKLAMNAWDNTNESALTIGSLIGSKGYYVTQWDKPKGSFPWDVGPQWVAHIQFDCVKEEEEVIPLVAKAMGEKGGICVVQGLMTDTNSQEHWQGVQNALKKYPGITLLAVEDGEWEESVALTLAETWLSRYGSKLSAISCANDEMALGVLQAVKAVGRVGDVKISGGDGVKGAVEAVKKGEMVATAEFDSYWQGVVGIGIAYKAATGEIDVNTLPHSKRAFNGPYYIITKENADKYLPAPKLSDYNLKDLWALSQGPVTA